MKIDRSFQFRGTRDYLHSTSLFDDLLEIRGIDATRIDMKFHRRTDRQVSYVDAVPDDEQRLIAEWSDAAGKVYVVERDESIVDATPYDEQTLADLIDIRDRVASIPASITSFSAIEAMVAGFKRLLQVARPEPRSNYAFVRIRLNNVPTGAFEIQYARDIGDFHQGDIIAGGKRIGQIFFGVWQ